MARIYAVLPWVCRQRGAEMPIIAFRDRLGGPQSALRHPASLGCPAHAFPGVPARRGEGSPNLRLSPVSPSSTAASPPKRPFPHPRVLLRPRRSTLTRPRPSTRRQRRQNPPSRSARPSAGSSTTGFSLPTPPPLRRSRRLPVCMPAQVDACLPSPMPGCPLPYPRVTLPLRLSHWSLTSGAGSQQS
jgi:hypothetical protein